MLRFLTIFFTCYANSLSNNAKTEIHRIWQLTKYRISNVSWWNILIFKCEAFAAAFNNSLKCQQKPLRFSDLICIVKVTLKSLILNYVRQLIWKGYVNFKEYLAMSYRRLLTLSHFYWDSKLYIDSFIFRFLRVCLSYVPL